MADSWDHHAALWRAGFGPDPGPPPPTVTPWSVWQHTSGRLYTVLHIANLGNTERYPLTIVYQDRSGDVYTRRADDWHRSMTALRPNT